MTHPRYIFSYNTNGLAHHRIEDAVPMLADLGYRAVALTFDVVHLDCEAPEAPAAAGRLRRLLDDCGMDVSIETGARFQLDPRRKHYPSLLVDDPSGRKRRIDFLKRSIDIAAILRAEIVSMWSGHNFDGVGKDRAIERLVEGVAVVADHALRAGQRIGFEPEPGMMIETIADFRLVRDLVARPNFGLALDIGHLLVTGEEPVEKTIADCADDLFIVAVEDMKRGVHDHLQFGDGDLDLAAVFRGLEAARYRGHISVELPRHSAQAPTAAARAIAALAPFQTC